MSQTRRALDYLQRQVLVLRAIGTSCLLVLRAIGTSCFRWTVSFFQYLKQSCFGIQKGVITMKVPFSFSIVVAAGAPLAVDVSGVPTSATVGVAYSGVIKASGGTPPYTFTLASPLPDGLTLNPDGTISGTPTVAGTFAVAGDVADAGV
jgi:hypothetical protein